MNRVFEQSSAIKLVLCVLLQATLAKGGEASKMESVQVAWESTKKDFEALMDDFKKDLKVCGYSEGNDPLMVEKDDGFFLDSDENVTKRRFRFLEKGPSDFSRKCDQKSKSSVSGESSFAFEPLEPMATPSFSGKFPFHQHKQTTEYSLSDSDVLNSRQTTDPDSLARVYSHILVSAAGVIYRAVGEDVPDQWKVLERYDKDGHKVVVYEVKDPNGYGNLAVFSFRGTANRRNWICNFQEVASSSRVSALAIPIAGSLLGISPALSFARKMTDPKSEVERIIKWIGVQVEKFGTSHELLVTGHSLGGFLSSVASVEYGIHGIGFSAPSLGNYENKTNNYLKTERAVETRKGQGLVYLDFNISGDCVPHAVRTPHLSTRLHGDKFPMTYSLDSSDGAIKNWKVLEAHNIEHMQKIIQRKL